MKIRKLGALFAALCVVGAAGSAQAETDEVVLARQFGIGYLPLTVMNTKHLVKKHLAAEGLKDTKVTWKRFGSGSAANDALLAGKLDYADRKRTRLNSSHECASRMQSSALKK